MSDSDELAQLREECGALRERLRQMPSAYLAALVGIIQGQRHPGADKAERAQRAREIERQLAQIAAAPAPEPVCEWSGHEARAAELIRDLRHFSGEGDRWTSDPSAGSAITGARLSDDLSLTTDKNEGADDGSQ